VEDDRRLAAIVGYIAAAAPKEPFSAWMKRRWNSTRREGIVPDGPHYGLGV